MSPSPAQPVRTPFLLTPRCPPVPETVYEEAFVPLEHGEMLQLQQPRADDGTLLQGTNSPRTFGALLSQRSRTRTQTTDLEGKSIAATPYMRSTNDNNAFATHTPVSFRYVVRGLWIYREVFMSARALPPFHQRWAPYCEHTW